MAQSVNNVVRRQPKVNFKWEPLQPVNGYSQSSQQYFLSTMANPEKYVKEVLYHGTRGVGKTEALIYSFAMYVGKGFGKKWRGVIFRKNYRSLKDTIKKSQILFEKLFGDKAVFKASNDSLEWSFPGGETLVFRGIETEKDYEDNYHGHEYPFQGWEELCTYNDLTVYHLMKSCCRVSADFIGQQLPPLVIRATTNPYGPGVRAVKKYFIDAGMPGEIVKDTVIVDDVVMETEKTHIFGHWKENYLLAPNYMAQFENEKLTNPNRYRAWVYGDWNVVSGGMFGDLWDYNKHVIPPFELSSDNFTFDRSFDWGSSSPYSVLFNAKSKGGTFLDWNDEQRRIPAGSIIVFGELYGAPSIDFPGVGLREGPSIIAEKIKKKEKELKAKYTQNYPIKAGPADNSIWNDKNTKGMTCIADMFKDHGIKWEKSNKNKGRVHGIEILKEMMLATINDDPDIPHIYFFSDCKFLINNFPILQVDEDNPDDIDTTQNDHDFDALRYKVLEMKTKFKYCNRIK